MSPNFRSTILYSRNILVTMLSPINCPVLDSLSNATNGTSYRPSVACPAPETSPLCSIRSCYSLQYASCPCRQALTGVREAAAEVEGRASRLEAKAVQHQQVLATEPGLRLRLERRPDVEPCAATLWDTSPTKHDVRGLCCVIVFHRSILRCRRLRLWRSGWRVRPKKLRPPRPPSR